MDPLPVSSSTPAHIRAFLLEAPPAFPLDWDLNRVAEAGYQFHHHQSEQVRTTWQPQSQQALARWAIAKLACSGWLRPPHWRYLEPESHRGILDSLQMRMRRVLGVADGRLPTWRSMLPPEKALQALRAALDTIRSYRFDVTFAEVADQFPKHHALLARIDAADRPTMHAAEQAAREAEATGEEPLLAFARALGRGRLTPTRPCTSTCRCSNPSWKGSSPA